MNVLWLITTCLGKDIKSGVRRDRNVFISIQQAYFPPVFSQGPQDLFAFYSMVGDTMSSLGGGDDSDPETVGPSAVYVTQGGQHTIIPPPPLPPHQQVSSTLFNFFLKQNTERCE